MSKRIVLKCFSADKRCKLAGVDGCFNESEKIAKNFCEKHNNVIEIDVELNHIHHDQYGFRMLRLDYTIYLSSKYDSLNYFKITNPMLYNKIKNDSSLEYSIIFGGEFIEL